MQNAGEAQFFSALLLTIVLHVLRAPHPERGYL